MHLVNLGSQSSSFLSHNRPFLTVDSKKWGSAYQLGSACQLSTGWILTEFQNVYLKYWSFFKLNSSSVKLDG